MNDTLMKMIGVKVQTPAESLRLSLCASRMSFSLYLLVILIEDIVMGDHYVIMKDQFHHDASCSAAGAVGVASFTAAIFFQMSLSVNRSGLPRSCYLAHIKMFSYIDSRAPTASKIT